jgi:hypothetical protein
MKTLDERIAAWLAKLPGAISGKRGHDQTFRVACRLYNGFALSEAETLRWLERYNERCKPAWSPRELAHKAQGAAQATHMNPRGYMLTSPRDRAKLIKHVAIRLPAEDTREPRRGFIRL